MNFNKKKLVTIAMMWTIAMLPLAATAQTRIQMPKNKYNVQDDVKLGQQASADVEKQFPILNDRQAQQYVESVGEKLVAAIPRQFQQSAFDYKFKVVNASDINAFALPGGPMYVNRGMIEAAKNEGEMAGVMAHEISHVALRHATAQATKQGSAKNTLGTLGMILGGAILGGQTGAQLGAGLAQVWQTKYSRDYETQADILGAQIMANAGYDPRDLANMFQTIAQQGGGRTPQWMSSHPDPGNRFQKINQEAQSLNVSSNPIKITREFSRVKERFQGMPKAMTMAQIEQGNKTGQGQGTNPTAGGTYATSIPYPSTSVRAYNSSGIRLNVPSNWREFPGNGTIQFAPQGAYGDQGITRGVMLGTYSSDSTNLASASREYVNSILQGNSYLKQRNNLTRATVAGRQGYSTTLVGRSPITGGNEIVTIYTAQLKSGGILYVAAVSPEQESGGYAQAFRNMLSSIRLND